ncbi:MAG: hypothetical protein IKS71_03855 [Bacteroidales bacterium]|nr:hypothetical protein [Bacteroidales bacterium]
MKKIEVLTAANVLRPIRLNAIKKASIRIPLVKSFCKLQMKAKDILAEHQTIVDHLQEQFPEEIKEVAQLRSERKPVTGHEDFIAAEEAANEAIRSIEQEEVTVEGLEQIKTADFIEGLADCDISLDAISVLSNILLK